MQFYKMPFVVFQDSRLLPNSKLLFCMLLNLCADKGFCWATNVYLAEKIGLKNRQIQTCLSELRAFNYVDCSADYEKAGARQIYINAMFLDATARVEPEKQAPVTPEKQAPAPKSAPSEQLDYIKNAYNGLYKRVFSSVKSVFTKSDNEKLQTIWDVLAKKCAENNGGRAAKFAEICEAASLFFTKFPIGRRNEDGLKIAFILNDLDIIFREISTGKVCTGTQKAQRGGGVVTQELVEGTIQMVARNRIKKQLDGCLMQKMGLGAGVPADLYERYLSGELQKEYDATLDKTP